MQGYTYMAFPFTIYDQFRFDKTQAEQGLMIFFHKLMTIESEYMQNLLKHFILHHAGLPILAQEILQQLPLERLKTKDDRSFLSKYVFSYFHFIVKKYQVYKLKKYDEYYQTFDQNVAKLRQLHSQVKERYLKEQKFRSKAEEFQRELEEFHKLRDEVQNNLADTNGSDVDLNNQILVHNADYKKQLDDKLDNFIFVLRGGKEIRLQDVKMA